jgi:hypothetical protein
MDAKTTEEFLKVVRQALLMIVRWIEKRYNIISK